MRARNEVIKDLSSTVRLLSRLENKLRKAHEDLQTDLTRAKKLKSKQEELEHELGLIDKRGS